IIIVGGRGRLTTHSEAIMGIFVTARKCPSTIEPARRKRTIAAVRRLSVIDVIKAFMLRSLLAKDKRRMANVPTLPASVGVKNPLKRPPITTTKMVRGQITPQSE